jgi:PEP-CTERM motif
MHFVRLLSRVALLALGPVWLTTRAHAVQIVEPIADTGTLVTDLESVPLLFPLFDANLGTLNDAIIAVTETMRTSGSLTNDAAQAQSFTFKIDAQTLLSGGPAEIGDQVAAANGGNGIDPSAKQSYTRIAPNQPVAFGPFASAQSTGAITYTSGLTDFQAPGGGGETVNVDTVTTQAASGGGANVHSSLSTTADVQMAVTYDYTQEVPEPSSIATFAAGLFGLGLVRRRTMWRSGLRLLRRPDRA